MCQEADGFATTWAPAFDGKITLDAISQWAAEKDRAVYNFGPCIPFCSGTTDFAPVTLQAELDALPKDVADSVTIFLTQALKRTGKASVIYICFGNYFW
jgi:hypothetical protein